MRKTLVLGLVCAAIWGPGALLAGNYLAAGKPNAMDLLPAPPLAGSEEQAADLASVEREFKNCSAADRSLAESERKFTVYSFSPIIGSFFTPEKMPKTDAFFHRVEKDVAAVLDGAKEHWQRPRPYVVEPSLSHGEPEKSFSYPSGHSTRATVLALLLADLVPDKREDILALGRNIGWRRVEMGRHYPTDIYAGRTLAQALVGELKASPEFEKELAEVRAEIQAAR